MNRPDCPPEHDASHAERVTACMTAFASAIKNITIYPADHPRVVERATAFVAEHKALACEANELIVHQAKFELDGVSITTDHLAVDWLQRRCRETGIGAIHIERNCGASDVITFASALIECRPGSGVSMADAWKDESACIRPVALVIEEHRARAPTTTATSDSTVLGSVRTTAELQEKLRTIAGMPSIQQLVRDIAASDTSGDQATKSVDLLSMITEVLPVDCPTDPQGLFETIEGILKQTQEQLAKAAKTDGSVRSADLLRSAVRIAKTYFGRSNKQAISTPAKPSGRPGDDAIQADLGALMRELAMLPDASNVRLPLAFELADGAPTTTKELLGICLHGLTSTEEHGSRSNRMHTIAGLPQHRAADCVEVLDTYLLPGTHSTATRLMLLRALVDNGMSGIVLDREYLDDALLRAGFPEVLPIAARAFASPDDQARARLALDDLATMIENGGAEAVTESGVLDDVATVKMLVDCGGKIALRLLALCESDAPQVQSALLACVQGLKLPECEQIVVHLCANDGIPPYYVRRLLRSAARNQFDAALRNASGELLRAFVRSNVNYKPATELCPAIDVLKHAPGEETEQFLREIARLGRFSWRHDFRELRQHAARTLEVLRTRSRS